MFGIVMIFIIYIIIISKEKIHSLVLVDINDCMLACL